MTINDAAQWVTIFAAIYYQFRFNRDVNRTFRMQIAVNNQVVQHMRNLRP